MNTITTYVSNTGSTSYTHTILPDQPCSKSYASLVLLQDDLLKQDVDYLNEQFYRVRLISLSRSFLYNVQQRYGKLCCTYCQRWGLVIEFDGMSVPHHKKATIDHVVPISHGADPFDESNLVVACQKCNGKKSNLTLSVFLSKHENSLNPNFKILSKFLK